MVNFTKGGQRNVGIHLEDLFVSLNTEFRLIKSQTSMPEKADKDIIFNRVTYEAMQLAHFLNLYITFLTAFP